MFKILVSCPTHISKEYSFQRWIDFVKSLTYPSYEIFVVDNSPNGEMMEKYGNQIPMVRLENPSEIPHERINQSMEIIRNKFLAGDYHYWFNLECDVIPKSPDIIELLFHRGLDADWIGHGYPLRGEDKQSTTGIGCSLLSRNLMNDFSFIDAGLDSPDVWLWEEVKKAKKFKVIELWEYMKIDHLDK